MNRFDEKRELPSSIVLASLPHYCYTLQHGCVYNTTARMNTENMSLEERKTALQKETKCPLADGRLFIFVQAMDPYQRHHIVLECPAKRQLLKNAAEWKVYEEDIRRLCCNPRYATVCEWYQKARGPH